jgi:diadenylate cyclase
MPIFRFQDAVDILVVTCLCYVILLIIRNTRAELLVKGIVFLIVLQQISELLGLYVLTYIIKSTMQVGVIAVIIVFQPELRRALEQLGGTKFGKLLNLNRAIYIKNSKNTVESLCEAVSDLSMNKVGSLIVIERHIKISDIVHTGIELNAEISPELIMNIFSKNTPLHDGAMILRDGKVAAATCILPLSPNRAIASTLGTRHRAALGISEVSDAVTIITSEETGIISITADGTLTRSVTLKSLENYLNKIFTDEQEKETVWQSFLNMLTKKENAENSENKEM